MHPLSISRVGQAIFFRSIGSIRSKGTAPKSAAGAQQPARRPTRAGQKGVAGIENSGLTQRLSENLERRKLMGGYSSGRYRTRNRGNLDSAIRLDIRAMRRQGFLKPGAIISGVQRWTWVATDEETGSVSVTVNLADPAAGFVVVRFTLNGDPRVQEIRLVSTPMRYGGRRYYFECPRQFRRCEVMPLVGGMFASRQAHRMTYASQSLDRLGRLRERSWKLEKRLWPGKGGRQPRGRNRERLLEAWERADSAFETLFAAEASRKFGPFRPG